MIACNNGLCPQATLKRIFELRDQMQTISAEGAPRGRSFNLRSWSDEVASVLNHVALDVEALIREVEATRLFAEDEKTRADTAKQTLASHEELQSAHVKLKEYRKRVDVEIENDRRMLQTSKDSLRKFSCGLSGRLPPVYVQCCVSGIEQPTTSLQLKSGACEIALTDTSKQCTQQYRFDRVLEGHFLDEGDILDAMAPWLQELLSGRSICGFFYGAGSSDKTKSFGRLLDHFIHQLFSCSADIQALSICISELYPDLKHHKKDLAKRALTRHIGEDGAHSKLKHSAPLQQLPSTRGNSAERRGTCIDVKRSQGQSSPRVLDASVPTVTLAPHFSSCLTEQGHKVQSYSDAKGYLEDVLRKRDQRSCSHCVATIEVLREGDVTSRSRVVLVDLAGHDLGDTCKGEEIKKINNSLSCLGALLGSMSRREQIRIVRDSLLTEFLHNSVANAKVFFMTHVSRVESERSIRRALAFAKTLHSGECKKYTDLKHEVELLRQEKRLGDEANVRLEKELEQLRMESVVRNEMLRSSERITKIYKKRANSLGSYKSALNALWAQSTTNTLGHQCEGALVAPLSELEKTSEDASCRVDH